MPTNRRLAPLVCAAVLAGCDGTAARDLTAPEGPRASLSAFGSDDVKAVTGHIEITYEVFRSNQYSFSAVRHRDGRFSGAFENRAVLTNGEVHTVRGDVVCFRVAGNRAWVAGVVREGTSPNSPRGQELIWNVTDNGPGGASIPPDFGSFLSNGDAANHCLGLSYVPEVPSRQGNVQIHR